MLQKLLDELGFSQTKSCKLYCDNEAAIKISENPVQHDCTKHVEVDRHFIKEKLEKKVISLPSVTSKNQIANILTKAVRIEVFEETLCKLGVQDLPLNLRGSVENNS